MNGTPQPTSSPGDAGPRVSVIVPAYNTAAYIAESLDSVFAQAFHDYEVIVVNDGSPDTPQLEDVLRPYMGRIQYMKQENRGLSGARNTAIRHSRAELLAFLDSDDMWMPGYLEAQVKFLDQNPRVVAAVADILRFGELVGQPSVRKMRKDGTGNTRTFDQMLKREGGPVPSATVVRHSRSIQAGLFDESLRGIEDTEFLYRLLFPDGLLGFSDQTLVKYRKHAGSITAGSSERSLAESEVKVLRLVARKLPLTASQRVILNNEIALHQAELAMMDAYQHLSCEKFDQAADCLKQANNFYHNPKLKVPLAGLKVFPHLTAKVLISRWNRRYGPTPPPKTPRPPTPA